MKNWVLLVILGVIFAIAGIVALANPFAATLTVAAFVGVVFLIGGVLQLWFAFRDAGQRYRVWNGVVGVIGIVVGVMLLADPLAGAISLTLLLGVAFLLTGVIRLAGAFALRETPLFWLLLISGAASVVLGILIFAWFPEAASSLLGILMGVELIAEGAALIAIGVAGRKAL